jgi:hypothetical protein
MRFMGSSAHDNMEIRRDATTIMGNLKDAGAVAPSFAKNPGAGHTCGSPILPVQSRWKVRPPAQQAEQ